MQNRKFLSKIIAASLLSLTAVTVAYAADPHSGPLPPGAAAPAQVDDALIAAKVKAALAEDKQVATVKINVTSEQGVVKISGAVPSAEIGQRALELAASVKGVRDVRSELTVKAAS